MRTYSGSWYDRRSARRANGSYSASKAEWTAAYRRARVRHHYGLRPDEKGSGAQWKAELITQYERNGRDPILATPAQNRFVRNMINDILAEE